MHSGDFLFNGKSRQTQLRMTADRTAGRDASLAQARQARQAREQERRRVAAAKRIQKVYRGSTVRAAVHEEWAVRCAESTDAAAALPLFTVLLRRHPAPWLTPHVASLVVSAPDPCLLHDRLAPGATQALLNYAALEAEAAVAVPLFNVCVAAEEGRGGDEDATKGAGMTAGQRQLRVVPAAVQLHRRLAALPESPPQVIAMLRETVLSALAPGGVQAAPLPPAAGRALLRDPLVETDGTAVPASGAALLLGVDAPELEATLRATTLGPETWAAGTAVPTAAELSRLSLLLQHWIPLQPLTPAETSSVCAAFTRADASEWFPEVIAGLQRDATAPSPLLFFVDGFPPVALAVAAATGDLATLDDVCAAFVVPYLQYATSPQRKREAWPYLSALTFPHPRPGHPAPTPLPLTLWRRLALSVATWAPARNGVLSVVHPHAFVLFASCYRAWLQAADLGASTAETIFSIDEARGVVRTLRDLVVRAHVQGHAPDEATLMFVDSAVQLLATLHTVDEAVQAMQTADWLAPTAAALCANVFAVGTIGPKEWEEAVAQDNQWQGIDSDLSSDEDDVRPKAAAPRRPRWCTLYPVDPDAPPGTKLVRLLQRAPFLVPFAERASVFGALLFSSRERGVSSHSNVTVRRGHVFEDAFTELGALPAMQLAFTNPRFINEGGIEERGYGPGVYREFVVALCREGFDERTGLFSSSTGDDAGLYPRPHAKAIVPDAMQRYLFLGRMVGKAMRDGILLDVPLARFFRNTMLGRSNGVNDLRSYDLTVQRNVLSLRSMSDEELATAALTFTVAAEVCGTTIETPLVRNGHNLTVSRQNVAQYVHLLADYKLNRETRAGAEMFRRGLCDMVPAAWLRFFDSRELQTLVQGEADAVPLNVEDWRAHTEYGGEYNEGHPTVQLFWRVVEAMTPEEQRQVLQFATAARRAPLLGFKQLYPRFTVISSAEDTTHLPSAATCSCMIKFPVYRDEATMRAKLLQAVQECQTFENS